MYGIYINILIIAFRIVLSGWLLSRVGCFIWVVRRYRTLRPSMNIWVGLSWYVVVRSWRVWCMVIIYARSMFCKMFCSPVNLYAISRSLKGL